MASFRNRVIYQSVGAIALAVGSMLFTPPQPLYAAVPDAQLLDMHLTPNYFAYRYNNMPLAVGVVGYSYVGGMMLPLSQTADAMGSFVRVDPHQGTASGWLEVAENEFKLDLKKRTLKIGGQERMIPQGAMSLIGDELYVDASYLATLMSARFIINHDVKTVDVLPEKPLRVTKRMEFMQAYFDAIRQKLGANYVPWGAVGAILASPNGLPSPSGSAGSNHSAIAAAPGATSGAWSDGMAKEGGRSSTATPQSQQVGGAGSTTHTTSPTAPSPAPASSSADTAASGVSGNASPPIIVAAKPDSKVKGGYARKINWENIVLDTSSLPPELRAVANPALNEDNMLILQPELDKVKGDYIEVYQHDGGYYLPLGHLMDMLEMGISVNPDAVQASGFIISEDRQFFLDGKTNSATVEGKTFNFPAGLVLANPFEVYVDAKLLSQILPLDFLLDMSQLVLIVQPRESLPLQARLRRELEWAKVSAWKQGMTEMRSQQEKELPPVDVPYKAASLPFVEVNNNTRFSSREGDVENRTSVVASGDVGLVNTETFAQMDTSDEDGIRALRFKAGRTDRKGELLGPLNATEVYAGDVESYPMSLVTNSDLGRGVAVSNRDIRRAREFDQTDFFGDSQPGWEVELYQNSVLIDFQKVGDDGRYEFKAIPIYFGDNEFRIVQYGPQGQKLEEVRNFNIDDSMPKPGEIKYAVSVNEREKSLFGLGDETNRSGTRSAEGIAGTGQVEYGINEKLAVNAGVAHIPVKNPAGNVGSFNFVSAGVKSSVFGISSSWDVAYDADNGGWATKVTALTRLGGTNIRGEQRFYQDFESAETVRSLLQPLAIDLDGDGLADEVRITNSAMESRSELTASRAFSLTGIGNFSAGLGFINETYALGERDTSLNARVSKTMLGTNFSNNLRFRQVAGTPQSDGETVDGSFSAYYRWDNSLLIRGMLGYDLSPDLELSNASIALQKNFTDDISGRVEYVQSFLADDLKRLNLSLNWDFDKFYLSPRFEIDQDAEYYAGMNLVFSLGMDPRTNKVHMTSNRMARSGAISAQAFYDENNNGVRDENEEILKEATFNSARGETPDEDGVTFMTSVAPHYPYRIALDEGSLGLMGAKPKEKAYGVTTRPGVTAVLDYPVVPTVEVEGMAYLQQDGEQLEYPGLTLELVDDKGEVVKTVRTEFDGYYFIEEIYPGNYQLRIAQKEAESKGLHADSISVNTNDIRANTKTGVLKNADFNVRRELKAVQSPAAKEVIPTVPVAEKEADAPESEWVSAEPQVPVTAPVPAAAPAPAPVEAAPAEKKPVVAEKAPAQPAPSKPAPAPKVELPATVVPPKKTLNLYVQSGLFCDHGNAERHAETLTVAGFKAAIKDKKFNGKDCFNVRVGPEADHAAAETMVKALQDMGIDKPVIIEESAEVYE